MAWSVKQIGTYRLYIDPRRVQGRAMIDLRPADGSVYWMWFTSQQPLPPNDIGPTTGRAYFPHDMLPVVIATLREEAPVFVQVEPDTDKLSLTTDPEPLGEGPVDVDAEVLSRGV